MFVKYHWRQLADKFHREGLKVIPQSLQFAFDVTIGDWWRKSITIPLLNSHSFLNEDAYVQKLLAKSAGQVTYAEIGANHPVRDNNTLRFYRAGSKGLNIEPNPKLIALFKAERPRDVSLNMGIGSQAGELTYYEFENDVLSTFSKSRAEDVQRKGVRLVGQYQMPVQTLSWLFETHVKGPLDLLVIDAEGFDLDILRSNNWSRFRPRVILVEFEDNQIPDFMKSQGYELVKITRRYGNPVNAIFRDSK